MSAFLFTKDGDNVNLEQLRYLNNEIKILREQVERLNAQVVTDVVTGSSKFYPFVEHKISIEGMPCCNKVSKLKFKLELRLKELLILQSEAIDFICGIDDSEIRLIFTLRYIENLTWQQVAFRLGRAGDGSTERKKHNRFLELSRVS